MIAYRMDQRESPSWTFERQPSGFTTMMKMIAISAMSAHVPTRAIGSPITGRELVGSSPASSSSARGRTTPAPSARPYGFYSGPGEDVIAMP
jgi:hypothetical protein